MNLAWDSPWALWLLPLALMPLWAEPAATKACAWVPGMPRDTVSELLRWALKAAAVLALAALVVSLAGPYRAEYPVERTGKGAEIVLVLDRSRSMDQGFAGNSRGKAPTGTGPEALAYYARLQQARAGDSKGKVARQLLAEFAARRGEDRFGVIMFSTLPMRVLEFTQKEEVIQAAITAGNIGRGLSDTDIGLALESALSYYDDRPYTGSRMVLLVSDGGDHIAPDMRERITERFRRLRVALYWIYIRSTNSPGLMRDSGEAPANTDTVPEYFLHRYFQQLGTPYRAYEAENTDDLQKAIADVDRLENLPITTIDTIPRRDLSPWAHGLALLCVLLLLGAQVLVLREPVPRA